MQHNWSELELGSQTPQQQKRALVTGNSLSEFASKATVQSGILWVICLLYIAFHNYPTLYDQGCEGVSPV